MRTSEHLKDIIEKARKVGDTKVGKDGKTRVWSKTPSGFDWRRVKVSKETSTSKEPKKKPLPKSGKPRGAAKQTKVNNNTLNLEIGDKVTVDGEAIGIVTKLPSKTTDQYSVKYDSGDEYGIMPSRMKKFTEPNDSTKKDKNEDDDIIQSIIKNSKSISIEKLIKDIGEKLGLDGDVDEMSKEISKLKYDFLTKNLMYTEEIRTTYSGAMHFPSLSTTLSYHLSDSNEEQIKNDIKENRSEERLRLKEQKKKEKNHDFRYSKPDSINKKFGTTNLKKIFNNFSKRNKNSHSSFGSTRYDYKLLNEIQETEDNIQKALDVFKL